MRASKRWSTFSDRMVLNAGAGRRVAVIAAARDAGVRVSRVWGALSTRVSRRRFGGLRLMPLVGCVSVEQALNRRYRHIQLCKDCVVVCPNRG